MKNTKTMEQIYEEAYAEALKAGKEVNCIPMVVNYGVRGNMQQEVIEDGVCGMASIKFKGNTKFGKWALVNGKARKSCMGGIIIYVGEFNQSLTRKEKFASTFVRVLNENGITASYESHID